METKFQTSFIPKKPLVGNEKPQSHAGTSLFMGFAVLLFVASLAGAGFVFAWKGLLLDSQKGYKEELALSEKRFGAADIEKLKKKDLKIDFVKEILKNHLSVSEIFNIIGGLTIDGVQFSSLEYIGPDRSSPGMVAMGKISMKGLANSFSSIAWQSDVLGKSERYGTNKVIKNPVLSDLAVDLNGNVGFSFTAFIDPSDISYEKVLESTLRNEGLIIDEPVSSAATSTN